MADNIREGHFLMPPVIIFRLLWLLLNWQGWRNPLFRWEYQENAIMFIPTWGNLHFNVDPKPWW